jgi:uncharacterized membrane protein
LTGSSDPRLNWAGYLEPATEINVGEAERIASVVGGSGLALYGLSRRTWSGLGLALLGGALVHRGVTGSCAGYKALGINTARGNGPRDSVSAQHGVKVEERVMILRPRDELYRFWRNYSNLPRIMSHLRSVEATGGNQSHWIAEGPMGSRIEWDAELITERENELIGWRSVGDSDIDTAGSVHFLTLPGALGTEVRVSLKYDPPAGKLGVAVARLLGQSPAQQIRDDLRRFKEAMEAGASTTEGRTDSTRF